jgi:hypothetical protein
MRRAILGDPQVVGVEAGLLVVVILMIAEQHANRGVDHFGVDAVALLVGHASFWIPSATMQVLELRAEHLQVFGILAGRCDETHRDWFLHPLDHKDVAHLIVVDHVRSGVLVLMVDTIDVTARRLRDVGIGGNNGFWHLSPSVKGSAASLARGPV